MQKIFNYLLLIIFLVLVSLFTYKTLSKPEILKASITDANQHSVDNDKFDQKVRDYILSHPEVIVESIEKLQKKKIEEVNNKAMNYLSENRSNIEEEGMPPILGNKNGDITIVSFYDYSCSYCKKSNKIINEIINDDQKVKVILRPLAILGEPSIYATKVALAVHRISEKKFPHIHDEIMNMKPITEKKVKILLKTHNIDYEIIDNELNSFYIKQLVEKNFEFAKGLGIHGAPYYVINGVFIPGFIDKERFIALIKELRKNDVLD